MLNRQLGHKRLNLDDDNKVFSTDKNDQKRLFELYICIISVNFGWAGVLKLGKKFVGAQFDLVSSLRAKYDVVVVAKVSIFPPDPASYCIAL